MSHHCFCQSLRGRLWASNIPNSKGFVKWVWHQVRTIVRNLQRWNSILMSFDHIFDSLFSNVEYFDLVIDTPKVDLISIETEGDTGERIFCLMNGNFLLGSLLPNSKSSIISNTGNEFSGFLRTWYTLNNACMPFILSGEFPRLNVPVTDGFISWASDQMIGVTPRKRNHCICVRLQIQDIGIWIFAVPDKDLFIHSSSS